MAGHIRGTSDELAEFRRRNAWLLWSVLLFSLFVNVLMLTGPLYMLQVYERVLGSGSEETLLALTILVVFLYSVMGVLDYTRGRIMARVGARFQDDLDRRVNNLQLTDEGRRAFRELGVRGLDYNRKMQETLGTERFDDILRLTAELERAVKRL